MTVSITEYATSFPVVYDRSNSADYAPRSVVLIGGIKVLPKTWSVELTTHGVADTASVSLGLAGNPDWGYQLVSADATSPIPIEIFVGFPPPDAAGSLSIAAMRRIFLGQVDKELVKFHEDECSFSARSWAATMIDDRIFAPAGSTVTTDFVTRMCALYGMTPDVRLDAGHPAITLAQVSGADFEVGYHNVSPWDTIKNAAEVDDAELWITDTTLHYVSPALIPKRRRTLTWGRDLLTLDGSHSPTFNKDVQVEVLTYNPKTRISRSTRTSVAADGTATSVSRQSVATSQAIFGTPNSTTVSTSTNPTTGVATTTQGSTQVVPGGGRFSTGSYGASRPASTNILKYRVRIPNASPTFCDYLAKTLASQISRYEFEATFSFAVTPDLLPFVDVTTLWAIQGLPWDSFNSPGAGNAAVTIATDPTAQAALNRLQALDPSWRDAAYRPKRLTIAFDAGQGDSGTARGLYAELDCVNHPLPIS